MKLVGGRVPRSFGVEEEYLLLDFEHGRPVDSAAELTLATADGAGELDREFFASQVETSTPVCRTAAEADASLVGFRMSAGRAAAERGFILSGTGLPPVGGDAAGTVTPKPRYRLIEAEMRAAGHHQYGTGTHVHVEVPNRSAGVDALARLARWAPALLALTANSPFWCGRDTGFASWRHVMGLSWPVSGYPQHIEDEAGYAAAVDRLVGAGIVPDAGVLTWVARLSERYPTLELRIADAQLSAEAAVSFALLVRAIVERGLRDAEAGAERPGFGPGLIDGANWIAARNGLGGELVDPGRAEAVPAFDLIDRLLDSVGGELDRSGDRDRVVSWIDGLRESGGPAEQQRRAFAAGGIGGLLDLFRDGSLPQRVDPVAAGG